jgi:hypothetical protein
MRGRGDPAWRRYYNACDRAHLACREGRITSNCLRVIVRQARRRAYREQT